MATELVRLCDEHLTSGGADGAAGARVAAEPKAHTVTIDGASFTLDLCAACADERLGAVVAWLRATGTAVKRTTTAPTTTGAPHAADEAKRARDRERAREAKERTWHPDDTGTATCPVCGREYGARTGLASHGRIAHGAATLYALYDMARALQPVAAG